MNFTRHFFVVAALIGFGCSTSVAEDEKDKTDAPVTISDAFGRYGYVESKDSQYQKNNCKISIDLNQQKFVEKVPELQKLGILNSELSHAKVNGMPNSLSLAFVVEMLPAAVKTDYENHPDIDRCQFSQFVTRVDDYGNDKKELAMRFAFTRELYKKINWDNFQGQKLPKIAPSFQFSPSFMAAVSAEASSQE